MPASLKRRLLKLWLIALALWILQSVIRENVFMNHEEIVIPEIVGPTNGPTRTSAATTSGRTPKVSRESIVAAYCKSHSDNTLHSRFHKALGGIFFADKKRKLLFALNFKVGASTLIRAIPNSSGLVPPNEVHDLKNVDLRTPKKLRKYGLSFVNVKRESSVKKYQSYFKFMFVRNPYHRLLSAFRDKFRKHKESELPDEWFTDTTDIIIKKYRTENSSTLAAKLTETSVTFEEFLNFIIDDVKNYKKTNLHWKPFHLLTMPCIYNYDFIGNFETFTEDFRYLMSKIAVVEVPEVKFHSAPGVSTSNAFKKYWRQIPEYVVQRINFVYKTDFQMFNYSMSLTDYL